MHQQHQSRLLQLPVELQLTIFEFALIEDEPLLVNCGCDSSYSGDLDRWQKDRASWAAGEIIPPLQPALTRTCVAIRSVTLPMFYKKNAFRAHYCFQTDFKMVVKWLKLIGSDNRCMLRDFCLQDLNRFFDSQMPRDIMRVKRSEVMRGLGGIMETKTYEKCCCHQITFRDEDEDYYEMVPFLFEG